MLRKFVMLLFILSLFQWIFCDETNEIPINNWLILGPLSLNDSESIMLSKTPDMLKFKHLPVEKLIPEKGKVIKWDSNQSVRWIQSSKLSQTTQGKHLFYFAVYLKTNRWLQTSLTLESGFPVAVYLDGKFKKLNESKGKVSIDLNLSNGKHLLVVKGLIDSKGKKIFDLKGSMRNKKDFENDPVFLSFKPDHRIDINNVLNTIHISDVIVSPDGQKVAVFLRQRKIGSRKSSTWVEIINVSSGSRIYSSENIGRVENFSWLKDSNSFSFTKTEKEYKSIYVFNLNNFRQREILKGVKDFSDYWWSRRDKFLIYSTERSVKKAEKKGYKLIKKITDRTKFPRFKRKLFLFYPESGTTRQIANEKDDITDVSISPDENKLLLICSKVDHKTRPYYRNIVYLFDVNSFKKEKLIESYWINSFLWSPDSRSLLLIGGPSALKELGKNLKKDVIPNDYDRQAYIFNISSKKAVPITKDFNPSISAAFWHPVNKDIYFRVTDKSYVRLYRYSLRNKFFKKLNTGVDVVSRISFADSKKIAVYWGSSVTIPHKLYKLNLSTNNHKLLRDYNKREFLRVKLGTVKDWNFKTGEGKTIIGRIYFPPGFNPGKKYPCIVYYYGGTSPVTRDFGGRYPKNWYAANGYVVYVLQPSGAVGFGQDFSAIHVNDWGLITSNEIITGVKKFLAAHPFVDPKRVGAIGASYGGFMTQVLGTKTDIFAALISHAGISSLSSYWGIGDWGYTYSAVATANSFPWNRKDIYVGHSPLFMAERFSSPLLLLHGEIDNNVPPGESYQMYAALKLLGKDVALITFKDQKHWILEYNKRVQWMKTIIAWFDKYLKDQPQHWNHMYGK